MSSALLNSILSNMNTRPETGNGNTARIASSNHNTDDINWVNGMTDPGEMLACGYLPQLRRNAGEQDREYQERITALIAQLPQHEQDKIKTGMVKAATQRAGYDTTTGRVAAVYGNNRPAWTRLGTVYTDDVTTLDLRSHPELNWHISKKPMAVWTPNGWTEDTDAFSLHRDDTGAKLTTQPVGSRYQVIQNVDSWNFLDKVVGRNGARYDAVGSIYGGREMFASVHMPKHAYKVGNHSTIDPYILFIKKNDGSGCDIAFGTEVRAECANTKRLALAGRKGKGIAIRHTGDISGKIADAQEALGLTVQAFETAKDETFALAAATLPCTFDTYAHQVLDAALGITHAETLQGADALARAIARTQANADIDALRKTINRKINSREAIFEDCLHRYESRTQNGTRGTAWGAYNAMSESADHGKLGGRYQGDDHNRLSNQMMSVIEGNADERKQLAYNVALSYAR